MGRSSDDNGDKRRILDRVRRQMVNNPDLVATNKRQRELRFVSSMIRGRAAHLNGVTDRGWLEVDPPYRRDTYTCD